MGMHNRSVRRAHLAIPILVLVVVGLVAADASAETSWIRRYGNGNAYDYVSPAMTIDSAMNVYIAGGMWRTYSADYATIKYDSLGNLLWERFYSGPALSLDVAQAIVVDDAGNVCVTGFSRGKTSHFDWVTVKYDKDGNEMWVASRIDPGRDYAYSIDADELGNVYVSGFSVAASGANTFTVKKYHGVDGHAEWERSYPGPFPQIDGTAGMVRSDRAGHVYAVGHCSDSNSIRDYAIVKYDTAGNQLWDRLWNGPAERSDVAGPFVLDADDNIYVTGHTQKADLSLDIATVKYDSSGNLLWQQIYDAPAGANDAPSAVALDAIGNLYVTGISDGIGTSTDILLLKYDADGNFVWDARYDGPSNGADGGARMSVGADGNIYIAGYSVGTGTDGDYAILKYDSDGNLVFERRYNGSGNGDDAPMGLGVSDEGALFVMGLSEPNYYQNDFVTLRIPTSGGGLSQLDMGVDIGAPSAAADHELRYALRVYNIGNDMLDPAEAQLALPPAVTYVSSTGGAYDAIGHTVAWNLGAYPPGSESWLYATVAVPDTVTVGTNLYATASVPAPYDANAANDIAVCKSEVHATVLSNEKLVTPHYDSVGTIYNNETLTYQIGFRNATGATVNTVTVIDTLDPSLDPSTVSLLHSSHPYTSQVAGNELQWTISGIALPDSAADEAGSRGFVRFSARPFTSVAPGTIIPNHASISLDGGPELHTNVVSNQIYIPCNCPWPLDYDSDGFLTALDMGVLIDVLFAGTSDIQDFGCPIKRGDFDCDGFTTSLDLSLFIDYLFSGGWEPCYPCFP